MPVVSKSIFVLTVVDALIIMFAALYSFLSFVPLSILLYLTLWFLLITMLVLYIKGFYEVRSYKPRDIYLLFEGITIATVFAGIPLCISGFNIITVLLLVINAVLTFIGILFVRIIYLIYNLLSII